MSQASVLFDAPGPAARRRQFILSVVGAAAALGVLVWLCFYLWDKGQITPNRWEPLFGSEAWTDFLLPGLRATIVSAFFAIIIAFVLGLIGALARMSEIRLIRLPAAILIEFFRAVPVLIMMIFALNFLLRYTNLPSGPRPLVAVVIGLVLYNGAVIAEVIRNGVSSLPSGQREAGLSVGLSPSQVRRIILVPQALTAMLPTLVSQLVVVLKDSALGYIILYPELLISARQMGGRFGNYFVALLVAAVLFILINYGVTRFAEWLEGRLKRRGHTAGKIGSSELLNQSSAAPGAPSAAGLSAGAGSTGGTG